MSHLFPYQNASAEISPCGLYRYTLTRLWDADKDLCIWIMLNPSIADAEQNDRTIEQCMRFARNWNYGSILVVNLFALRATNPADLLAADDPIGPKNDWYLEQVLQQFAAHARVLCAWGNGGSLLNRANSVYRHIVELRSDAPYTLGLTKRGQPRHPLYVPNGVEPLPFALQPA